MTPLVSVIVPVYNVKEYLGRCVDSILRQTEQNIEVILVDDGAQDGSGFLCDQLAAEDARVQVVHQANGGAALARNTGMKLAKGTYLAFADGDDWVLPGMYQDLVDFAQKNDLEIAAGSVEFLTGGNEAGQPPKWWVRTKPEVLQKGEDPFRAFILTWNISGRNGTACNKLYKRDFIEKHKLGFNPQAYVEDMYFNLHCYAKAARVGGIDKPGYVYCERNHSVTYTADFGRLEKYARLHWDSCIELFGAGEDGEYILAYSGVRLMASLLHRLKVNGMELEKACETVWHWRQMLGLEPHLQAACGIEWFAEYVKLTGIEGLEKDNYYKFVQSLTGDYEEMLRWQTSFLPIEKRLNYPWSKRL